MKVNIDETRKDKYIKCINRYGVYTLLILLQEYEQQENYEECDHIYNAINEVNNDLKSDLPTLLPDNWKDEVRKTISQFGLKSNGSTIFNNIPSYIEEIKSNLK